jgi:predicted transcriptional regulator
MDRMHDQRDDKIDAQLSAMFAEYRMACPDPEPSADFMPGMWKRIEARRVATVSVFKHWAQVCVMATVALTLLIGAVLIPKLQENSASSSSYLEALTAEHSADYVRMLAGGPR